MSERRRLPGDDELARWIGSVRAEADPALWTRVRARIAERERMGRVPAWLARPRALVASLALCMTGFALALVLAVTSPTANDDPGTLAAQLQVAVEGSDMIVSADASSVTVDSGGAR